MMLPTIVPWSPRICWSKRPGPTAPSRTSTAVLAFSSPPSPPKNWLTKWTILTASAIGLHSSAVWVEDVAQSIAQEIECENSAHDRQPREHADPWSAVQKG